MQIIATKVMLKIACGLYNIEESGVRIAYSSNDCEEGEVRIASSS